MLFAPQNDPFAEAPEQRIMLINQAHDLGIKTWISFEPVLFADDVLYMAQATRDYVDKIKIGKLNYHPSNINWAQFGREAEALCKSLGLDYYIKDSLRAEMEKG